MEICADFLEWLGPDTSTNVLMLLDDPSDTVRVSAVSKSWRRFVISNGFSKKLCLRLCAEASYLTRVVEGNATKETTEASSSSAMEWANLEKEHNAFSYLSYCLFSPTGSGECIAEAIRASSTDNYPDESIENTLIDTDRVYMRPSYWSSQGESDPGVPETLTYRLGSKLCIVNEIKVQPFEAYFQNGSPIYSAKAVRFRMGHSVPLQKSGAMGHPLSPQQPGANTPDSSDEKFVWTYVSPEFPMVQQSVLQSFKLPRPVLCIGGIVQIELLGRVQVQEMDNLYYMCVCHVQAIGRPFSPAYEIDIDEVSGNSTLKYFPEKWVTRPSMESNKLSGWQTFSFRGRFNNLRTLRGWNHPLLATLLGVAEVDFEVVDEDHEPL